MERPRQETLPRDQNVPPFPSWATRTNVAIETLGSTSTWSYRKEVTAGIVAYGVDGGKVSVFLEAPMPGPGTGAERGASGAGDLVRRHEPRVPEGPEGHAAVGPDHQVGDAAVVEGEAEPAFGREL